MLVSYLDVLIRLPLFLKGLTDKKTVFLNLKSQVIHHMLLRQFMVLSILMSGILGSACSENNVTKTDLTAANNANEVDVSLPKLKLQRLFEKVTMDTVVLMLQAPGDDKYWYFLEKPGRVLRIENKPDAARASVFLDISDRVDAGPNEAGLLGMAFHPEYAKNGFAYLSYTADEDGLVSRISRFENRGSTDELMSDSETILLKVKQPYSNHNGGNILFGPDGYLYIGFGDGGSGGDPQGHGQNTQTLLGSILRIDVNDGNNKGAPYAIPASNPFVKSQQGRPEIYAWGLRNPWRWSFDRETGAVWIADVGQNNWEEVSIMTQPGNFGWNKKEGSHCYQSAKCDNAAYVEPIIEYSHDDGCSITGGYVYRGTKIPGLQGVYLYADFCSGKVWGARKNDSGGYNSFILFDSGLNIASFAEGNDGELYLVHIRGEVYKIAPR